MSTVQQPDVVNPITAQEWASKKFHYEFSLNGADELICTITAPGEYVREWENQLNLFVLTPWGYGVPDFVRREYVYDVPSPQGLWHVRAGRLSGITVGLRLPGAWPLFAQVLKARETGPGEVAEVDVWGKL